MHASRRVCLALVGLSIALVSTTACSIDPSPSPAPAVSGSSSSQTTEPPAAPADPRSAEEVFEDLAKSVQSVKLVKVYTEDDDPNKLLGRPSGYTSKVAFSDSRISEKDTEYTDSDAIERGGSIEVYGDPEGAKQRAEYIQAIGKSSGLANEYDYLNGPILVRVTDNLSPSKAKDYQAALG
jgi:hypothetical protein